MTFALFKKARNVHCHSFDRSNIEDIDLKNITSAYSKHVGSRSTCAHRDLAERGAMVNDNSFFSKRRATCIDTLSIEVILRI